MLLPEPREITSKSMGDRENLPKKVVKEVVLKVGAY